jgi:hypothetical protein
MKMPQWFPLPRPDVSPRTRVRCRRTSVVVGLECLEQRTLLSAAGLGPDLASRLLRPDLSGLAQQTNSTSTPTPGRVLDLVRDGSGHGVFDRGSAPTSDAGGQLSGGGPGGGPHYPPLPSAAPAARGEAPSQPPPTVFAVPVNAPDGTVPVAGVPLAPAILPGSLQASGLSPVASGTAGAGLVGIPILPSAPAVVGQEGVSAAVAPRLPEGGADGAAHAAAPNRVAVDVVFRHQLLALAGRAEQPTHAGARPEALRVRSGLPAAAKEGVPSQPDRVALAAHLAGDAATDADTALSGAAPQATEETGLPAPLSTLANPPGAGKAQPESRTWLESLVLSSTAVLEVPSVQEVAIDTAAVLAGCLVAYGLQRSLAPAKETTRRSAAVLRRRP